MRLIKSETSISDPGAAPGLELSQPRSLGAGEESQDVPALGVTFAREINHVREYLAVGSLRFTQVQSGMWSVVAPISSLSDLVNPLSARGRDEFSSSLSFSYLKKLALAPTPPTLPCLLTMHHGLPDFHRRLISLPISIAGQQR